MTNQSRRQFLKTGALFGAVSAAAAVSAPAFSTEAPQKWDETTGLLIVGTGFAGCAAAPRRTTSARRRRRSCSSTR